MAKAFFFWFLLALYVELNLCYDDNGPEVEIKQGILHGKYGTTRLGRRFSIFLSIPFAEPPVGDLRFKPPVPGKPWKGVRNSTENHEICPQRNVYVRSEAIEGVEDCLYLNVYTPQLPSFGSDPLPVMIFLHGGGWFCGSGGSQWYGPDMLLDKDAVLVIPNFRLGPLGFLTTGDEVVPGNNGMKDQALVIKWVKDNIAAFGGDPNGITVFGESAGGVSAHLHMLSPVNKGMLKTAISHSGTATCSWAVAPGDQGVRNGKLLAKSLNCPTEPSQAMVDCLRKIDVYDIIAQDKVFMKWDTEPMIPFKPVIEPNVEGAFLTQHPIEIIKSGNFDQIPWITGINNDEGALRAAVLFGNPHLLEEINANFNEIMAISLLYDETAADPNEVSEKIRKFYFDNKEINNSTKEKAIQLYTDAWFLSGQNEAVRLHKAYTNHPVYYYLFAHRGVSSFSYHFGDPRDDYGVCHADELQYLFPVGDMLFPDDTPTESDKRLSEIMITLWWSFAKNGNPTPEIDLLIPTKWEPVKTENLEYYYIGADGELEMRQNLFAERGQFWRNLKYKKQISELKDEL